MAIDDNTSYELTGAQVKDLASKINAKEDSADLAAVAESGSYNDLSDKPTIGNATLTIQKNGTSAGTFTANATSNKTINITVPTTAADVSALPASTKYGASIAVSINTTDYKVTTTLKDQDGNTLGTAQVIDLPLESVVVNGSYDNTNKKIVLTLQNGNTIDIPVADLVAGLQTEITSTNKLSSDLVDDTNHTHKFVTAAQITKLNGIATGAEVNQNAFSNVKVGSTTVAADTKTDTLELVAGSNVTLTPDATNDKVTIAATDTTYSDATTSTHGLMSAADKTKLNGIAAGAEVNVQSDWDQTTTTADDYIKNKPSIPTKTSDLTNDSGFITTSALSGYLPLTGGTLTGKLTGTQIETGTAASNYLQTKKFRGQGDASSYYHAIDFGYANHDQVDFYEYGGIWNFWKNTTATATTDTDNLALGITLNALKNKSYTYTFPNKTGTFALTSDLPTVNNATLTIQKNGANVQTFTANSSSNKTANITVPTKTSDLTNDSNFVASGDLATVATSGSYNDLSNKPTIPAAQVQSNWTQTTTTAVDYIKNKPTLATVATSGSYNDLSNKPTIPTVNNATLTIQKNGTNVQTFTANSSSNKTANITVPTKTSELSNDSNFVASGDLATVATSGSYNDLSNKPTIPTVNNATLTIQKNGTTVNTFTANSSNNVTANIPVPTLSTTDTDPGEGSALAADTFLGVYDIAPTAIDGSRITNGTVTTNKLASGAVTAAKVDFSTFGVAATVNGPSSTTSKSNGATWASTDMYTGSVSLAAGTYLVVVTGSAVAFSAGGEQEWFNVTIDSTIVMTGSLAWFTGSVVGGNGVGIATVGTSGTHTVAYQLGAQGARTCTLYGGSKIQFVRIG